MSRGRRKKNSMSWSTQEEELDVVVDVAQHKLFGIAATPIPRLPKHLGGGQGQRTLVGNGNS